VALSDKARQFGLPAPRGILLLGIQGCGKSLTAKAVGQLWNLPLMRFDVGRVFGSLVGSSEQNIRRVIQIVESVARPSSGSTRSTRRFRARAATPTAARPRASLALF